MFSGNRSVASFTRLLPLAALACLAACGGDDGGPSSMWDPSQYELSFSGTMEVQFSFYNSATNELYTSPDDQAQSATVEPNADYTSVIVKTDSCTVVGTFRELHEDNGARLYDIDRERSSCHGKAGPYELSIPSFDENVISWSKDDVHFLMSGVANIPGASSIFLFHYTAI
jgi:hypothetical protein